MRDIEGTAEDHGPHGNGGYFNFQPGEMYVGGGMWMPEKPRLDAFRQAVRTVGASRNMQRRAAQETHS